MRHLALIFETKLIVYAEIIFANVHVIVLGTRLVLKWRNETPRETKNALLISQLIANGEKI